MDVTRKDITDLMEFLKDLIWETKPEAPMEEGLEIKKEDSVFIKRRIRFALKDSEETVQDDTSSSDEYPAVNTRGCNDDPGCWDDALHEPF